MLVRHFVMRRAPERDPCLVAAFQKPRQRAAQELHSSARLVRDGEAREASRPPSSR